MTNQQYIRSLEAQLHRVRYGLNPQDKTLHPRIVALFLEACATAGLDRLDARYDIATATVYLEKQSTDSAGIMRSVGLEIVGSNIRVYIETCKPGDRAITVRYRQNEPGVGSKRITRLLPSLNDDEPSSHQERVITPSEFLAQITEAIRRTVG